MSVAADGDGIDRAGNDDAARALLKPEAKARTLGSIGHRESDGGSRGPAAIDEVSGEVSGGGSGTGGGNAGEDFDDDHTAGSNTER